MPDFRINVVVDAASAGRGIRQVERQLGRVETAGQRLARTLTRALAFAGIGLGVRELIGLTDTFTNLQNRIRIVTNSQEELASVTDELFRISRGTRSSFEATTEVYARTALAARDLGISQRQTLDFTESLNRAVILSGASAQEAQAGLIQLSQGLASGALRGDELRSVLEQLPVVADVIAEELGVTRGRLRELGAEGAITADIVLRAFANAREELEERFGKTVPTIGQSFTVLRNAMIRLIGTFNESSGAATAISQGILFLAENAETAARAVAFLATVLLVQYAQRAIPAAIAATTKFTLALLKNPLGLLAVAISTTIGLLITFGDRLRLSGEGAATLFDVVAVLGDRLSQLAQTITSFLSPALNAMGALFRVVFGDLEFSISGALRLLARFLDIVSQTATIVPRILITAFRVLPRAIADIFIQMVNAVSDTIETFVNNIVRALNNIPGVELDLVDVPELQNKFKGAGELAGQELLNELKATLEPGAASEFVDGILEDAQARAAARTAPEQAAADLSGGGAGAAAAGLGAEEIDERREALQGLLGDLDPVVALEQDFADNIKILDEALDANLITVNRHAELTAQLAQNLDQAKFETEEFTDSLRGTEAVFGGLQEALNNFGGDIDSTFDVVSSVGETALNSLTDQIISFTETGKFSFRSFADTVLQQLQRIALQMAITRALGGFGSGGEGGTGLFGAIGGLIQGRQSGGPVAANRPFLVGEGGPELFVPRTAGQIVPNGQAGGMVVQQTFNIQTPDVDGFRRSESQIRKTASRSLRRAEERR